MKHLASTASFFLVLTGCVPLDPGGGTGPSDRIDPVPIDDDAGGACARPDEGCPCDTTTPMDCFLDPLTNEDGAHVCQRGTRYCRGGLYTACEDVRRYELVSGPGSRS